MVGFETSDDAAVYLLDDDTALLLTVDFFTPIVDDPRDFGRITAANALSDIYAMGGRPLVALNLLAFPCGLGPEVVAEVLAGGADKVREAGAVVVGGHTIDDEEPKFGLAVLGVARPDQVVRNSGSRPGDVLILTKPVGTGLIGTALKRGLETEETAREAIESMAALNRDAADAMAETGVNAATDVTGFGVLGHLHEMALASGCAAELDLGAVPLLPSAREYAEAGVVPGRTADVVSWSAGFTDWRAGDEEAGRRIACDPQTSGGLLVSVPADAADGLAAALESRSVLAARVGRMLDGAAGDVRVV